eukprot:13209378-Alexandrium_andersonii.AAC.1
MDNAGQGRPGRLPSADQTDHELVPSAVPQVAEDLRRCEGSPGEGRRRPTDAIHVASAAGQHETLLC